MEIENVTLIDVRVLPQARKDSYQFQFVLSRIPERFWPECFASAYSARSGLRRIELNADTASIVLTEDEAEHYIEAVGKVVEQANIAYRAEKSRQADEERRRIVDEQQRRERAAGLQRRAKQLLGI